MIPIFGGSDCDYSWLGRNDVKVECPLLLDLSSCVVLRCSPFILFQVSAANGSSELISYSWLDSGGAPPHPNQENSFYSGCIHGDVHASMVMYGCIHGDIQCIASWLSMCKVEF